MRKLIALIAAAALAASLSACAAEPAPSAVAEPAAAAHDLSDENYLSWTKSDWNRADDQQKNGAARFVLFRVGDAFIPNFQDVASHAETDPDVQALLDQSVDTVKEKIGSYFEQAEDGATLGDMVADAEDLAS